MSDIPQEVIAIGIAGLVASTSLNRRREFAEEAAMHEALVLRLESEKAASVRAARRAEERLLDDADGVAAAIAAARSGQRAAIFAQAVREAFRDEGDGEAKEASGSGGANEAKSRPAMI